jgi:hypothetical protein
MIQLIIFSGLFLVLLCLLLYLVYTRFRADQGGELDARLPVDFLLPRRSEEYAHAQMTLAGLQAEIRRKGLSSAATWPLLRERNEIARDLMTALREDFIRLDRLMCALAAVSPEICREKELQRLWLSLRFKGRYRLALLSLSLGAIPANSIPRLQLILKDRACDVRSLLRTVDSTVPVNLGTRHVN